MASPDMQFNDGQAYERLMGRWSRLVGEQFVAWLAVPPGKTWLDVGCGNGAFTQTLIERCAPGAVKGIDPSEGQIAYARDRAETGMAAFEVGDSQALPYGDSAFDAAVMALVISFVPDPAKAVAEMARVVRAGGTVAAYMWDFKGGGVPVNPIYIAMAAMGIERLLPPSAHVAQRQAMVDLWTGAGLRSVESEVIRIPVTFASFDDFWESNNVPIGPQGMALKAMTPEKREQLKDILREQLPADASGRISYESFANAVKGTVPG